MYNQFCCSVYICLFDALSFSRTRTHNLSCKEIKKNEEGGIRRRYEEEEEEEQEAIVSVIYRSWGLVFFFCPFFFW